MHIVLICSCAAMLTVKGEVHRVSAYRERPETHRITHILRYSDFVNVLNGMSCEVCRERLAFRLQIK